MRVNGELTDFFDITIGLRQGCILSPTLFNLFINDLLQEIKDTASGVAFDNDRINILAYADDIALISSTQEDMQNMLSTLKDWCDGNRMMVNLGKTKLVHFRRPSTPRTDRILYFNNNALDVVQEYRYLGLQITEHLDLNHMAKCVANAASRSLGLVIAKFKALGGLHHNCFKKLYETLVDSVISYGSPIWGYKTFSTINAVQNRACRFFLGVGKYTPNSAVQRDMGWKLPEDKQWVQVSHLWCRINNMNRERVNYKVFAWSRRVALANVKNWSFHVAHFYRELSLEMFLDTNSILDICTLIPQLEAKLKTRCIEKWKANINKLEGRQGQNKLRTYRMVKTEFEAEQYTFNMNRGDRSALAKFRCGTAPIKIETGRYEGLRLDDRVCPFGCATVENEIHVIVDCPTYEDIRADILQVARAINAQYDTLSSDEKFVAIMTVPETTKLGKLCNKILSRRRILLYD